MKNKDVLKKYNKNLELINKYNHYYFNLDSSLVSDQEYDTLKDELLNLEIKYPFLKKKVLF